MAKTELSLWANRPASESGWHPSNPDVLSGDLGSAFLLGIVLSGFIRDRDPEALRRRSKHTGTYPEARTKLAHRGRSNFCKNNNKKSVLYVCSFPSLDQQVCCNLVGPYLGAVGPAGTEGGERASVGTAGTEQAPAHARHGKGGGRPTAGTRGSSRPEELRLHPGRRGEPPGKEGPEAVPAWRFTGHRRAGE